MSDPLMAVNTVNALAFAAAFIVIAVLANRAFVARRNLRALSEQFDEVSIEMHDALQDRLDEMSIELHDVHCREDDWPHAGECVAFEGYEAVANPLLSTLASHGYARRADVTADWLHLAPRPAGTES